MKTTKFFQDLLELDDPWRVTRVEHSPEGKVDVFLEHRGGVDFPCPECGLPLSVWDHTPARSWRHLDCCGRPTWLHARLPRVRCLFHRVRQVAVPWALSHCHFTMSFERHAIATLHETDVSGATRLLDVSWDEAWHLLERAVARGQRRKRQQTIVRMGVDEKAIAKGHQYFTLVCDLDRNTVEYVAEERKAESLNEFYETLTEEQRRQIAAVAMDMWEPFISATKARVPEAERKIVFDRFHIMKHMNEAVDTVRKREHRSLLEAGDNTLKGTKYLWLYAAENVPEQHASQWRALQRSHLKTGRAWAIKECLRHLWDYRYRAWAEKHWSHWYYWATHSRLPAVVAKARTLERHLPSVLNYFEHRITNALCEGMNSKIEEIKKTPVAFAIGSTSRRPSTFTAAALILIPARMSHPQTPQRERKG